MINPKIFKAYDIRGIYPKEINENNIETITKAILKLFQDKLNKKNLQIVLGRDMRLSSPVLHKIVKKTLIKYGQTVIDIGLSSTPSVYFAVYHFKYDAGIQISASHNPKQYNGIKLLYIKDNKLIKVSKDQGMEEIRQLALENKFNLEESQGQLIEKSTLKDEINFIYNLIKPQIKKFKIVTDTANAVGSLFIEEIFKRTDCQLIKLNWQLDGTFPAHEANPLKFETLKKLQEKIIKEKADFGIATDGDGDRIFFIDENGKIVPSTLISSVIAQEILLKNPNETILVDIRYIKNVSNLVKKLGGQVVYNVVGHSLITKKLNEVNGAFSGESSGHYFFRETGGAESTIKVIYYILDVLTKKNKPLSEIVNELMTAYESGEYNFVLSENLNYQQLFKKIARIYQNADINYLDGISVSYNNWRFNIRASNTEPLIRLNLEADDKKLMKEKLKEVKNKILEFIK